MIKVTANVLRQQITNREGIVLIQMVTLYILNFKFYVSETFTSRNKRSFR